MQASAVKGRATVRLAWSLICSALEGKGAIMSRKGLEVYWQTGLLAAYFWDESSSALSYMMWAGT